MNPRPGLERIRLHVDGLGAVDADVARSVPGAAELLLAGPPPAPARVLHRRAARIVSLPPAAPDTLGATLLALPDAHGGLRSDAILALLETRTAPAEGDAPASPLAAAAAAYAASGVVVPPADPDRRAGTRVPLLRTVALHQPGAVSGIVARTVDVSEAGLAVVGAAALVRGDLVRVRVLLDGARPLEAIGEVRRRHGDDAAGLELVRMRPQDRVWLDRWLHATRAGTAGGPDVLAYASCSP